MDLYEIENSYKRLSEAQLVKLVKEANTLDQVAIPLLRKELIQRGLEEEALKLDNLSAAGNPYETLSLREIQLIVTDRLETGESLESIHADLKEHGVNVMNLFQMENDRKEQASAIIEAEPDESFPKEKLMTELNYKEEEIEELKSDIKGSGIWYKGLGIFFLCAGILYLCLGLATNIRWTTVVVLLLSGYGLLSRGRKLSKKG